MIPSSTFCVKSWLPARPVRASAIFAKGSDDDEGAAVSYFRHFGMEREPFGTTPDPAMFYRTLGHEDCYERLKLAIALQRGLSVIIGDVGYGKTTIKVALMQELQSGGL